MTVIKNVSFYLVDGILVVIIYHILYILIKLCKLESNL